MLPSMRYLFSRTHIKVTSTLKEVNCWKTAEYKDVANTTCNATGGLL